MGDRPPHGKERLLSISMIRMNIVQASFQLAVLFTLASEAQFVKDMCNGCNMFGLHCCKANEPGMFRKETCTKRQNTLVFNAFVFCQFWNEINCRKLKELNVFERFFDSYMFSAVLAFTFVLQFAMVEGLHFIGTNGLDLTQWAIVSRLACSRSRWASSDVSSPSVLWKKSTGSAKMSATMRERRRRRNTSQRRAHNKARELWRLL